MLRGLYTAAAGMDANRTRAEVLAQNLANTVTPGYKRDMISFAPFLSHALVNGGMRGAAIGQSDYGAAVDHLGADLSAGPLRMTGRFSDLALVGDGFFTLENAEGDEVYTRSGEFGVDTDGYLIAAGGYRVLGEGGTIQVGGGSSFNVDSTGDVHDAEGEIVDRLRVSVFDDPAALVKQGNNCFSSGANAVASEAESFQVRSGALEGANVDVADEMGEMVKVTRAYEAAQRLVRAHDQLAEKAISQVGSVR